MSMTAKCLPNNEWSFSSRNQSPCEVTAVLGGICGGAQFNLAPLEPGVVYLGPSPDSANSCVCSSVYYALLSACAYCQARSYIRWSSYTANCSTSYLQRFVDPIPPGIVVPLWAYQDVSIDDTFNVTLAKNNATTVGSSSIASTTSQVPTTGSATDINVAAIAGGLVGGFIIIGFVVGFVTFCLIRRHSRASRVENRMEDQDHSANITVTPHIVPGFSSSVNPISSQGSRPRVPHPLSQSISMDTLPPSQVSPLPLSSRNVPFSVTAQDSTAQLPSVSRDEYLLTRITPYTVLPPSSLNAPYASQDSKQALFAGPLSNFTDMPTTSNTSFPSSDVPQTIPNDPKFRGPASQMTSSSSLPQQHYQLPPQQGTSTSPFTISEQLPPYSEIMAGPVSATFQTPVLDKQ